MKRILYMHFSVQLTELGVASGGAASGPGQGKWPGKNVYDLVVDLVVVPVVPVEELFPRESVVIRVHLLHSGTGTVYICLCFKLQFSLCTETNNKYIVSDVSTAKFTWLNIFIIW